MNLGAIDIEYSTRVTSLLAAWTFIMENLEDREVLSISIIAQWWQHEGDSEWVDTLLVTVQARVEVGR